MPVKNVYPLLNIVYIYKIINPKGVILLFMQIVEETPIQ